MRLPLKDFYAYNNFPSGHKAEKHSCGHAAILSLFNFYRKVPWVSIGYGQHKRRLAHIPFLEKVYKKYPPEDYFFGNIKFTVRESILKAMKNINVNAKEGYKGMQGYNTPKQCYAKMMDWIHKYQLPVLVLLDGPQMGMAMGRTAEQVKDRWFSFHWGFVVGETDTHVIVESWESTHYLTKSGFMKAWHCHVLPYPNNYYAIYTWD